MLKVHVIVKEVIHSSGEDNDFEIMCVFSNKNSAIAFLKKLVSLNTDRDTHFAIMTYRVL